MARAVLAYVAAASIACGAAAPALAGTDLGSGDAPDFILTDGRTAAPLALSSLRGKVVVLSFLYTRCPDICPLTAETFRVTQGELAADADEVVFLAVSTDPDHDTPRAVQEFSRSHRLDQGWHYLIGSRAQLASVWTDYGIVATPDPGLPTVTHTDAVYLIDRQSRERVLLRTDALDESLLHDLRILIAED
ncbi:MAG: SCO family protein [Candidatus Limnocylindria bacterium]